MTSSQRLREMVAAATPGPWIINYDPMEETFFHSGLKDSSDDPDATLIALAPSLALLVADMGEALARVRAARHPTTGNAASWALTDGLLARLDALMEEGA